LKGWALLGGKEKFHFSRRDLFGGTGKEIGHLGRKKGGAN